MDRRDFIRLTAISGTGAALSNCGGSENTVIRFVPDEELVPGVAEWKPSVCPLCSGGCGLTVRVMEADVETVRGGQSGVVRTRVAKKLEGAPSHPVNQGTLCARGQAGVQITYHPDRITQPLRRRGSRQDGVFEPITWDQAISELVSRLDTLVATGQQKALAFLTAGRRTQRQALIDQFAARFGASPPIAYELFTDDVLRQANRLSFGREQLPTIDLAHTRFLLSFGADFLGTWNSPVAQSVGYGLMRQGRPGIRGAFVQVEARMTPTGASADQWVPVVPGTEGSLALGIAHVMLRGKLGASTVSSAITAPLDGWADGLPDHTPEKVATITGVPASRIERLARDFADRRPSVAIIGGPPLAHTNGLAAALAVNALNALAGSVGQPGGLHFTPEIPRYTTTDRTSLDKAADDILSDQRKVQVLLVDGVNPVFSTPRAWRVGEALDRIPFIVSFGSFVDETTAMADLVLPDHSFLESWVDAVPESGSIAPVASVAAPVMKPLFETRATPDVLLEVARALARPLSLPWRTFEEMLKGAFDALGPDAWSTALKQGGWWGPLPSSATKSVPRPPDSKRTRAVRFSAARHDGDPSVYPFYFLPYPSPAFLDGALAHLPWLQELPDPMTSAMWSTWVEINPRTAAALGIGLGDIVEIASRVGTVSAPAFVSPGIAPDVIAMPVGQGHRTFTRYASGRGANPISILAPVRAVDTGAFAWAATRVKVARVGDPDGRLILFSAAGALREHPNEERAR